MAEGEQPSVPGCGAFSVEASLPLTRPLRAVLGG